MDPGDAVAGSGALREAREETGLDPAGVEVLGSMPDLFLPPSGFVVTPVLALVDPSRSGRAGRSARGRPGGASPLDELLDPANRFSVRHPSGYTGPGFAVGGLFVWGFTAGLLARVLAEAGLERPWDATRFEPLPDLVGRADRSEPSTSDAVTPERGAGDRRPPARGDHRLHRGRLPPGAAGERAVVGRLPRRWRARDVAAPAAAR